MEVSVEQTSELNRKMTVTLAESAIQSQITPKLKKLAGDVRIDGFRKGKAPVSLVNRLYGAQVREEVIQKLIETSYFDAIQEQNLNPAGYPQIEINPSESGFVYTAHFEVYPTISLEGIVDLPITQQHAQIEESDIDEMITKLREQRKTWEPVERSSQTGDRVTIDFSGHIDGETFTDGTVENYSVELGSGQMMTGFEDNLVDLNIGDSKSFILSFPHDHANEKLAGKPATFDLSVKLIESPIIPEISPEFIRSLGLEDETDDAFRSSVKENMARELKNKLKQNLRDRVFDAVYQKLTIALPQSLVQEEIDAHLKSYTELAKKRGLDFDPINLPREMFETQAQKRVALSLILGAIVAQHNLEINEDRVRALVEEMAQSYEKPQQIIEWYYKDDKRLSEVRQNVMEEQIVEWLLQRAIVTTENTSFNAVMNPNEA